MCGRGGAERVVRPEEVDVDRPLKDLGIAAVDRQLGGDAGVGDHDVEPAEMVDGSADGRLDLSR